MQQQSDCACGVRMSFLVYLSLHCPNVLSEQGMDGGIVVVQLSAISVLVLVMTFPVSESRLVKSKTMLRVNNARNTEYAALSM